MQFLAQIPLRSVEIPEFENSSKSLLLFQCQNDPGMCDEWDASSGGNAALLADGRVVELPVPAGEVLLAKCWHLVTVTSCKRICLGLASALQRVRE